jgi:porin
MTGNWGGVRSQLEKAGITLRAHYTSESACNPVGGIYSAARYTQQFDFGANLDLHRLGYLPGKVLITFTDRAGDSLSADALGNNKFAVQEVFGGGRGLRLVELHYRQESLNKRLLFDIGWAPVGSNFATSTVYCSRFQTLATCGTLQLNNGDWLNWPFAQWGAMLRLRPRPEYYVSAGIYQVNPIHGTERLNLTFTGTGILAPLEIGWLPGQGADEKPGEYKLGVYYDSSQAPDVFFDSKGLPAGLTGGSFARHNGRWGAYALATQMVYREAHSKQRGLTLFGMMTVSDPKTETFRYFYAGAYYQGTFSHRDDDFISVLFTHGSFNSRLTQFQEDRNKVVPGVSGIQIYEDVAELDYAIAVTSWLQVRPNLQYVFRPDGTGKVKNAFVVGLFTNITF